MDFRLTDEQEGVRRLVRDVVEKEVKPLARHTDETGEFPAEIAKKAHREGTTLKAAAMALGCLTEEEFDRAMDLKAMCRPKRAQGGK